MNSDSVVTVPIMFRMWDQRFDVPRRRARLRGLSRAPGLRRSSSRWVCSGPDRLGSRAWGRRPAARQRWARRGPDRGLDLSGHGQPVGPDAGEVVHRLMQSPALDKQSGWITTRTFRCAVGQNSVFVPRLGVLEPGREQGCLVNRARASDGVRLACLDQESVRDSNPPRGGPV